jgi:WD40 repeat protein
MFLHGHLGFVSIFEEGRRDNNGDEVVAWYDAFVLWVANNLKGQEPKFEKIFLATRLAQISELSLDTNKVVRTNQTLAAKIGHLLADNTHRLAAIQNAINGLDSKIDKLNRNTDKILDITEKNRDNARSGPSWFERLKYWKFPHTKALYSASFSPRGDCIVTAGMDGKVSVWSIDRITEKDRKTEVVKYKKDAICASFSPDGTKIISACLDGTVDLSYSASPCDCIQTFKHSKVTFVTFSPDGHCIVTSSRDGTANIWACLDGSHLRSLVHPDNFNDGCVVNSAYFSPNGNRIVTGYCDSSIFACVWSFDTGELLGQLIGHQDGVCCAAFSHNGQLIVSAGAYDGTAQVWNAVTFELITANKIHEETVWCAEFSPDDSMVVTAGDDRRAIVWDVTSKNIIAELPHDGPVITASFSPCGTKVLTACGDGNAYLWIIV